MTDDLRSGLNRRLASYRETLDATSAPRLLLDRYSLHGRIPHVALADALPTPVTTLDTGEGSLWVKRDDLTSTLYGGNKVRKLEFLLAAASDRSAVPVVVGATGSHQVLAAALYARLLGLGCAAVVFPQPPAREEAVVKEVLEALDIPTRRAPGPNRSPLTAASLLFSRHDELSGKRLLYPGGSSPAGNLGYVNCGLEIAEAVAAGECPEPEVVVTAFGTGGTAVGLALGLALGGLDSRVHAVRVAEPVVSNRWHLRALEWRTRRLLRRLDIPVTPAFDRIGLITGYLGEGYGHRIPEAQHAVEVAAGNGLTVDHTYTAKALAAALDYQSGHRPRSVMFLHTLSAADPLASAGEGPG